ncbi:ComEA family DNA-binding protein [Zunongwangia endophytica]|uniref:ComEA family DNA-binding protein n=1 Tax=Zunongwangia endophytica TaxID=1808945 RepID=A0ABV8H980_9FLAO|nr:helix-hairpin-helix domain-containing protein [Zunongwangia endophytica]MDN3595000.1 helix-hairpin-helix domain-containing protein [Zunongwangia endophytica]
MKYWKSHFVFNKSERNGIFVLIVIIVLLQIIYYSDPFSASEESISEKEAIELKSFQSKLDSLKNIQGNKDTIYPFNPNYLSDYKAYRLGMSVEEIDRLLKYRATGKWINSSSDFQKVTKVSDSLLNSISPNFKFPDWIKATSVSKKSSFTKIDINTATAVDLMQVKGIGESLGKRLVKYRTLIGGYRSFIQLQDVYGLTSETRLELESHMKKIPQNFSKHNINEVTVIELSEIPYLNYELARALVNYRILHEKINSVEDLIKIEGFPVDKIDRIQLYLSFN